MPEGNHTWRLWRQTPEFSQRFEAVVRGDEMDITGRWEKSFDGGITWEHDFNVRYGRAAAH
jgi:hypothetical protein